MYRRLLVLAAVFMFVIIPTAGAQQIWYLTDTASSINIGGGKAEYVMYKDSGNGGSDVIIGSATYWIASQPAQTTLSMSGTWTINLECIQGGRADVSIGVVNTTKGPKYDSAAIAAVNLNPGANSITFSLTGFVIEPGEYLAVEIKPKAGTQPVIDVTGAANSPSYVQYYSSVPPYPIPELTTVALLGAGLIAAGTGLVGKKD